MDEYKQEIVKEIRKKCIIRRKLLFANMSEEKYIKMRIHSGGINGIVDEIYDTIKIEEFNKYLLYLLAFRKYQDIKRIINSNDTALKLYLLNKVYPNLSCYTFLSIYNGLAYTLKTRDFANTHNYSSFFVHSPGCPYLSHGKCDCIYNDFQKDFMFTSLCRYHNNKLIHPLWELWELSSLEFNNYSQWLPRELIEQSLSFYSGKYSVDPNTYID